jgi:hypothetical protein
MVETINSIVIELGKPIPYQIQPALIRELVKHQTRLFPGDIYIGQTCAAIFGIPRLGDWNLKLQCLSPESHGTFRPGVSVYTLNNGLKLTGYYDTLLELARDDSIASLAISISHCLNKQMINYDGMKTFIASSRSKRGIKRLKAALRYASELDESPLETLTRLYLVREGYVLFEQQVERTMSNGNKRRFDFYIEIENRTIVIEADGRQKFVQNFDENLDRETAKNNEAQAAGITLIRVSWTDVFFGEGIEKKLKEAAIPKSSVPVSTKVKRELAW